MVKYKNRIYRILTNNELKLRTYVCNLDENDDYKFYLADMEYIATKK